MNDKDDTKFFTDIVYSINNACPDLLNFGLPVRDILIMLPFFLYTSVQE